VEQWLQTIGVLSPQEGGLSAAAFSIEGFAIRPGKRMSHQHPTIHRADSRSFRRLAKSREARIQLTTMGTFSTPLVLLASPNTERTAFAIRQW